MAERWLDLHKARIMLWTSMSMLVFAVTVTWRFGRFLDGEKELEAARIEAVRKEAAAANERQASSIVAVRDEVAEVGDSTEVLAVQVAALKELFLAHMDGVARDQGRLQDDLRRIEGTTASELRELRADLRVLSQARDSPNGEK